MLQKIKDFFANLELGLKAIWLKDRVLIISALSVLLLIKGRDFLIDLLVSSAKGISTKAVAKDDKLAVQEQQANASADELVKEANELPAKELPVGADWYLHQDKDKK